MKFKRLWHMFFGHCWLVEGQQDCQETFLLGLLRTERFLSWHARCICGVRKRRYAAWVERYYA